MERNRFPVASAIALGVATALTLCARTPVPSKVRFDEALAALLGSPPANGRVGLLLDAHSDDAVKAWYLSQYALAPWIVLPIYLSDCGAEALASCVPRKVDRLLVPRPSASPEGRAFEGFEIVAATPSTLVLTRKAR